MSKTPEQMAKEYGDYFMPGEDNKAYTPLIKEIAWLAGYQAAKDEINSSNNSNGWISVKERLPKEAQEVLIYTERRDIYMARIYKDNEAYPFSNGCGCCGSEERYTHWMLPEAPKEEG